MIDTSDGDIEVVNNIDINEKQINNGNAPTVESARISTTIDEISNTIDIDGDAL